MMQHEISYKLKFRTSYKCSYLLLRTNGSCFSFLIDKIPFSVTWCPRLAQFWLVGDVEVIFLQFFFGSVFISHSKLECSDNKILDLYSYQYNRILTTLARCDYSHIILNCLRIGLISNSYSHPKLSLFEFASDN